MKRRNEFCYSSHITINVICKIKTRNKNIKSDLPLSNLGPDTSLLLNPEGNLQANPVPSPNICILLTTIGL